MAFLKFRNLVSRRTTSEEMDRSTVPYPSALLELLVLKFGIDRTQFGIDLGPGSGRLAQLFLNHGYTLLVASGESKTAASGHAHAAEQDSLWVELNQTRGQLSTRHLAAQSVDFVISERALYTGDRDVVKAELRRILRPNGVIALITDNRVYGGGTQSEEYVEILRRHCTGFREKQQPTDINGRIGDFFSAGEPYQDAFVTLQELTLGELVAQTTRLAIYPAHDSPEREPMQRALVRFFQTWSVKGVLRVPLVCRVVCGRVEMLDEARSLMMQPREAAALVEARL